MRIVCHVSVLVAVLLTGIIATNDSSLIKSFIDEVNKRAITWRAGSNSRPDTPIEYIERFRGVIRTPNKHRLPIKPESSLEGDDTEVPTEFDARIAWPDCPSIAEIADQGKCKSCWAVATAGVLTDRYCIQSNATKHFTFSADDLLTCCSDCGVGCSGGYYDFALAYWVNEGVVSGGSYGSNEGCRPYEIAPWNTTDQQAETPPCTQECLSSYGVAYKDDKKFGKAIYGVGKEIRNIQLEIMKYGPVLGSIWTFADLDVYKSGIYRHVYGRPKEEHALRIIGWGVEGDSPYWLTANSWGKDWGENGFLKIPRGEDEDGIEDTISAGIPSYM